MKPTPTPEQIEAYRAAREHAQNWVGCYNETLRRHFIIADNHEIWGLTSDDYDAGHSAMTAELQRRRDAHALSAALSVPAAAVVGEPDGWKLVPLQANWHALENLRELMEQETIFEVVSDAYRYVIDALPSYEPDEGAAPTAPDDEPECEFGVPDPKFRVGQLVEKASGYKWPGVVVSRFLTQSLQIRYVVECTVPEVSGALHIYSESQLVALGGASHD